MEKKTVTWTHPITKETEEVEVGSDRARELKKKMNEAGLWAHNDPDIPEGCMTHEEFCAFLDKEKVKTSEERYQEYLNRKSIQK